MEDAAWKFVGGGGWKRRGKKRERILPHPAARSSRLHITRREEVDGSGHEINSIFYAFGSIHPASRWFRAQISIQHACSTP